MIPRAYRSLSLTLGLLLLAGCGSSDISIAIERQLANSAGLPVIDLARAAPGEWDRVCILGPYSDNKAAKQALGFDWDVESNTSISSNEGIALLLFVRDNNVVTHVEHPRRHGDFSGLTGRCFARQGARLHIDSGSPKDWPRMVPERDASSRAVTDDR